MNGSANSSREHGPVQEKAEASSLRNSEKRVRFSEELIQSPPAKQSSQEVAKENSQDAASSDSRGSSSASRPKKSNDGPQQPLESPKLDDSSYQDKGRGPSGPPVSQQQPPQTENTNKDINPSAAPSSPPAEKAGASLHETSIQPVELTKDGSNTNTGEQWLDDSACGLRIQEIRPFFLPYYRGAH